MKRVLIIGLLAILMLVPVSLGISSSTENIAYAQDTKPKEPFTTKIENNKYIINYSGDMVYVGKGTDTFVPEITMYRFGDECHLTLYEPTINGQGLSQKNASSTLTSDTIQWASKDLQFLFYPKSIDSQNDRGSFEYEIVIANSKAGTDRILSSISFPITSSGLIFYYQLALTPEEIADGAIRPDNVVGSYAVYHSTKAGDYTALGGKNYMAGKAFHIYRPKLIDNAGDTAWADLIITGDTLTIDFSKIQGWLNKAKYPVVIDPTFGYTMEGGTNHLLYPNTIYGCQYAGAAGTGISITWNLKQSSSNTPIMKFGLFDANDDFVTNGGTGEWTLTEGWDDEKTLDFTIAPTLIAQNYRIALWADAYLYSYYDAGETGQTKSVVVTYNGWPASIGWEGAWDRKETVYCTYTLGGVPPNPPTDFVASDNLTDKITCTWTKSDDATKYQVYRDDTPIGGELGDVDTFDDMTAVAPVVTPGAASATDGMQTAHVVLSVADESVADGTTYAYKVRAGNADGWSSDSGIDNGHREPGAITYQWQRSAGDADGGYGNIIGATTDPYNDIVAPAPTITAGNAVATDGDHTGKVSLSLAGTSSNDGAGRWYRCVLNADGAAQQISTTNRGYRDSGALSYQWQRSSSDADEDYSNIVGAVAVTYEDIDAPEGTITPGVATASDGTSAAYVTLSVAGEQGNDGVGRYYQCVLSAPHATGQTSDSNRGYRTTGAIAYQWQRSATDSNANYATLGGATTDPYNDTTVPEDEGRWYCCEISATGVVTQNTTPDRGYLGEYEIIPDEAEPLSVGGMILRMVPIVIAGVVCIFVIRWSMNPGHLLFGAVVGILTFLIVDVLIKLVNG